MSARPIFIPCLRLSSRHTVLAVDVPGHVWEYGRRLAAEIVRLCADAGLPGRVIGPPFRMVLVFDEPDEQRVILMRTLLQQELLKQRVFTFRGLMLPSLAHDDEALAVTAVAYEKALAVVAEAARDDSFVERLEIPEVISHEASMVLPAVPRS